MDTPTMFSCTVMHPRLFPALITDPGNPLRVQQLVEVAPEELIIRAPAPRAKGKIMGDEHEPGHPGGQRVEQGLDFPVGQPGIDLVQDQHPQDPLLHKP